MIVLRVLSYASDSENFEHTDINNSCKSLGRVRVCDGLKVHTLMGGTLKTF